MGKIDDIDTMQEASELTSSKGINFTQTPIPGLTFGRIKAPGTHAPEAEAPINPAMTGHKTISILMSTYAAEKATHLAQSLESIFAQTLPPNQLVLVLDGPIPPDQRNVIRRYEGDPRIATVTLVNLPENGGLAKAMNAGLLACTGDYIARMDSDDICLPDRLKLQASYLETHPDIDLVSSWADEFFPGDQPSKVKVSPVNHEHVSQALRWRNVIIHPTIMVKSTALRALDGYRSRFAYLEDYDLFMRLVQSGYKIHVLPKILLKVRTSLDLYGRRGGLSYCMTEMAFRFECWKRGFLKTHEFLTTTGLYMLFRMLSGPMRQYAYSIARTGLSGPQSHNDNASPTPWLQPDHWREWAMPHIKATQAKVMDLLGLVETKSPKNRYTRFLTAFSIVMLCMVLAWPMLPRRYATTSSVILHQTEQEDSQVGLRQGILDDGAIQSEIDRLSSPVLITRVINQLGLLEDKSFNRGGLFWSKAEPVQVMETMRDHLSVVRERRSYTLKVNFWHSDPVYAAKITNALVSSYLEDQIARKQEGIQAQTRRLEERVAQLQASYQSAQVGVRDFMAVNGISDRADGSDLQGQLNSLSNELAQARARSIESQVRAEALGQMQWAGTLLNAPEVVASQQVQRARDMLAVVYAKPAALATETSSLKTSIEDEAVRIISTAEHEAKTWQIRKERLQNEIETVRAEMVTRRINEMRLDELRRTAQSNETSLNETLAKLNNQLGRTRDMQPDADIVAVAEEPLKPAAPNGWMALIGTLFVASTAGGFAAIRPRAFVRSLRRTASALRTGAKALNLKSAPSTAPNHSRQEQTA